MNTLLTSILTGALAIAAPVSFAGPQQQPPSRPPEAAPAPPPPALDQKQVGDANRILPGVPITASSLFLSPRTAPTAAEDNEIAGLPGDARPVVLTWERIYALALVRTRSGHDALAATLDPAALDPAALEKEADRLGVADFDRFRGDFSALKSGSGDRLHDPSAAVLKLLTGLHRIDNARWNIARHENIFKFLVERIQGESSGLQRLDLDAMQDSLVRARQKRADEVRRFRDGLDELKVDLGLSPSVAVVLDRHQIEPYRVVRDWVDEWSRKPDRHLDALYRLNERLPSLGDVVLDGEPVFAKFGEYPEVSEELLTSASRLAIKNLRDRSKDGVPAKTSAQLELRVRRRLRNLFEIRRAYLAEQRRYELAIRLQDQALERMLAPSGLTLARSVALEGVIEHGNRRCEIEEQLVGLWMSFRAERVAIYRDLGVLPYKDWAGFYADLAAPPGAAAVPAVAPRPADGNAPPPPPGPQG
jgi:hypothetical protein